MGLHLMSADQQSVPGVRSITRDGDDTVIRLQGAINFTAAENILHELTAHTLGGTRLVLDVSRVTSFNRMGRRMVKEGLRRLREDGFQCSIYDPDGVVTNLEFSDGTLVDTVDVL